VLIVSVLVLPARYQSITAHHVILSLHFPITLISLAEMLHLVLCTTTLILHSDANHAHFLVWIVLMLVDVFHVPMELLCIRIIVYQPALEDLLYLILSIKLVIYVVLVVQRV